VAFIYFYFYFYYFLSYNVHRGEDDEFTGLKVLDLNAKIYKW